MLLSLIFNWPNQKIMLALLFIVYYDGMKKEITAVIQNISAVAAARIYKHLVLKLFVDYFSLLWLLNIIPQKNPNLYYFFIKYTSWSYFCSLLFFHSYVDTLKFPILFAHFLSKSDHCDTYLNSSTILLLCWYLPYCEHKYSLPH